MMAPTAGELIEAIRERMTQAGERPVTGFEARVIANVLAIIERELALGPDVAIERAALLADFSAVDDEALAAAIRAGDHDDHAADLRQRLAVVAEAQLTIDNPRWL